MQTDYVNPKPGSSELPRRFEMKFFVLPEKLALAYMLLKQLCRPDYEYAEGQVTSLYFDSYDLDQYSRAEAGDFKKDKVRIRWYGTPDGRETMPVYLELKSRAGFAGNKKRSRMMVPAQQLERSRMRNGIIQRSLLMETLAGFGHYPELPLQPVIVIWYQRHRFTEIQTGTRVAFDQNIRSYMVSRESGYGAPELQLRGGVIEVKGTSLELPATLRRISTVGADWTRFSKYGSCVESHLAHPGSAGHLWPSGRTGIR